VKALHDYAAMSEQFSAKIAQAAADMAKEPMKSKM